MRSDNGVELAEVISVSGTEVRVAMLDRAQTKPTQSVAAGDSAFAKRRNTKGATYNWQPGKVTNRPRHKRKVTVERPSGFTDDFEIKPDCLRVFTSGPRVWSDMDGWNEEDTASVWVKSERQAVLRIGQAVRLPTSRYDCTGYFSIVMCNADFRQLIGSLDALASTQPRYIGDIDGATHTPIADEGGADANTVLGSMHLQLGHGVYSDVIQQRCKWPGGLDALRSKVTFIASDGSYDGAGRGAWGLVVCRQNGVVSFSGRVDSGCGTNSPYRSEAYGLLTGLRFTFGPSRRHRS